jgi:hypothetical protein
MLDPRRWWVEREIMRGRFPWIWPFETPSGHVGFFGHLRGPRSGWLYEVVLKIPARLYPETKPPIYLDPRIGSNWRVDTVNHDPRGKLCYDRPGYSAWNPARSTFANCIGIALDYLADKGA